MCLASHADLRELIQKALDGADNARDWAEFAERLGDNEIPSVEFSPQVREHLAIAAREYRDAVGAMEEFAGELDHYFAAHPSPRHHDHNGADSHRHNPPKTEVEFP